MPHMKCSVKSPYNYYENVRKSEHSVGARCKMFTSRFAENRDWRQAVVKPFCKFQEECRLLLYNLLKRPNTVGIRMKG